MRTTDVEAYELFLEARALFQARRDLATADGLLAKAVEIDPHFADALAIRGVIREFGGEYGGQALGHLYDHYSGNSDKPFDETIVGLERALELDPANPNTRNWLGLAYSFAGNHQKAVATFVRCIESDPALAACRSNLAVALLGLGQTAAANAVVDAGADMGVLTLSPVMLLTLADLRRRDAFLFQASNAPHMRGWRKFGALYDAFSRPVADHRALAAELKAFFVETDAPESAFELLNALGDYSRPLKVTLQWIPAMRGYRRSPEFTASRPSAGP